MTKPILVYGTLRPGHNNFRWAQACVQGITENVTTPGKLYWVEGEHGYPVAKFDVYATEFIHGDILHCDENDEAFRDMVRMEVGAGYELRTVACVTADGKKTGAYGFHYLGTPRGRQIEGGDWSAAVAKPSVWEFDEGEDEEDEWESLPDAAGSGDVKS